MTTLLRIAGLFALLSLLSVGGGNGVIPDMQRAVIQWY
jgi:chromate transport protein ChrA